MSRLTEIIEEPETGKLSATRIVFLLWTIGSFIAWGFFMRDIGWIEVAFMLTLGGFKVIQRQIETRTPTIK